MFMLLAGGVWNLVSRGGGEEEKHAYIWPYTLEEGREHLQWLAVEENREEEEETTKERKGKAEEKACILLEALLCQERKKEEERGGGGRRRKAGLWLS